MRFFSILSLLAASVSVLAQAGTSTTTAPQASSTCEAQNILDTCLRSIQAQVDSCSPNDWGCLCEQTNNLLTCYNNCPEDGGRNGVQQQKLSYCNAASLTSTTTSTTTSTSTSTGTATSTSTSSSAEETGATTTSGGAAAEETSDGAAVGNVRVNMGLVGAGLAMLGVFV
ncbi:hypothetical protein BJX99DRAFT_221249 [Aspergillus californicus]